MDSILGKGKKILFLATVDSHIYYFHIPFMKLLRDMGYDVEVAAGPSGFKEKIQEEGFEVYLFPFSKNPLSFNNVKVFFMLLDLMKKQKYVMVHTHTPVASFVGRIAAKIAGVPHIVYTAHGFHFHEYGSKFKNFIYYRLEKFAGQFTDVLITINEDDYRIATEKNMIPYGRVVYIKGVGIDTVTISPESVGLGEQIKKEINLEKFDGPVIVSVGRLEREKHFDQLIKALRIVKNLGKEFSCFVIGDGKQLNYLQNEAKQESLSDKIIFTGYSDKIAEYLQISSIFAFTSSREGLPVSVMEAMAMEKPVVAYNIRGVRDLVVDGETGFLVKFGDINALAEKIIFLIDHPDVAKAMGKKGRKRIEKNFSLDIVLKQMSELYNDILGEK